MTEQVAVLGCGPAGLLAAHAVALSGREPVIYSRKVRSPIGGAQYLHCGIPGVADPGDAETVTFVKRGSAALYAKKVYGDLAAKTSWDDYEEGEHRVWNMRAAYNRLWNEYEDAIRDTEVTPRQVVDLTDHMLVVSSIPLRAVCPRPQDYEWYSQTVFIEYGTDVVCEAGDMQILYDGTRTHGWYRCSNLFGWKGIEWPYPVNDAVEITKPLSSSYPGPEGVLTVGRYGKWKKGELIHHAFEDVTNYFKKESVA